MPQQSGVGVLGLRSDLGMGAERYPFGKMLCGGLAHLAEHRSRLVTSMSSLLFTLGLGLRQNYQ